MAEILQPKNVAGTDGRRACCAGRSGLYGRKQSSVRPAEPHASVYFFNMVYVICVPRSLSVSVTCIDFPSRETVMRTS